jgi:hypothetical protein
VPQAEETTEVGDRLQEPAADERSEAHHPELEAWLPGARDPTPAFDDAAHAAMHRDLRTLVQDLANEGKRPGQLARMFGLKPVEVRQMLSAKP